MTDTYALAIQQHTAALSHLLVARVCCDNAATPTWWCELLHPRAGKWMRHP